MLVTHQPAKLPHTRYLLRVRLLNIGIMVIGVLEVMDQIPQVEMLCFLSLVVGDVGDLLFWHGVYFDSLFNT